jgi:hypothetical protein
MILFHWLSDFFFKTIHFAIFKHYQLQCRIAGDLPIKTSQYKRNIYLLKWLTAKFETGDRREIIVRRQSYFSRLPKY